MAKRIVKGLSDKAPVASGLINKLAASLNGKVILPNDKYSQAWRVWNHAVNAFPQVIVCGANTSEIMRTIEFARQHDLVTAIIRRS